MDLIPRLLFVGIFSPPPVRNAAIDRGQINQIWTEVSSRYDDYGQLQVTPDGSGAQFLGATEDSAVTIQPPLLQVRDAIALTPEKSAEKAADILRVIARHLGTTQFFNLGIRHVFHSPTPNNDAPAFMLHDVLGKTDEDVAELAGGGTLMPGLNYMIEAPDESELTTLKLEPLLADRSLILVDHDIQAPGPTNLDVIEARCSQAKDFVQETVSRYLDKHAP